LQAARHGAAIRRALPLQSSTCRSVSESPGCAGAWPAITLTPVKAGVLIRSVSVGANPFRVIHRRLSRGRRRHHAPCRPPRQALMLRPRLLRRLAQARDRRSGRPARRFVETPYNNSLTSDFSSFSSATDALIFSRLNSLIARPCTISHFPPRTRTGNEEINPCSTP
jgi:hypothetical protein